jgi:hypothetical protein
MLHLFYTSTFGGEQGSSRPGPFDSMKNPQRTLNRRLGGPQRGSGLSREKRKRLLLPRIDTRLVQPMA